MNDFEAIPPRLNSGTAKEGHVLASPSHLTFHQHGDGLVVDVNSDTVFDVPYVLSRNWTTI
jgi:hypothetical protein